MSTEDTAPTTGTPEVTPEDRRLLMLGLWSATLRMITDVDADNTFADRALEHLERREKADQDNPFEPKPGS